MKKKVKKVIGWGGYTNGKLDSWKCEESDRKYYAVFTNRRDARSVYKDVRPIELARGRGK